MPERPLRSASHNATDSRGLLRTATCGNLIIPRALAELSQMFICENYAIRASGGGEDSTRARRMPVCSPSAGLMRDPEPYRRGRTKIRSPRRLAFGLRQQKGTPPVAPGPVDKQPERAGPRRPSRATRDQRHRLALADADRVSAIVSRHTAQTPPRTAASHSASRGQPRRCRGSSKLTTAMARPNPAAMRKTRS